MKCPQNEQFQVSSDNVCSGLKLTPFDRLRKYVEVTVLDSE